MENTVEKSTKNVEKWTPLLLMVCFFTTIGTAIPVGYFLGVMNTPAEFIKAWCKYALALHYDVHLDESNIEILWAAMVSIFLVGGICGSFFGGYCCDRFGRKGSLLLSGALLIFSGFLLNFCRTLNSVEMLFIGRLVAGAASALIFTAHPMYLLELAPARLRGSVAVCTSIGVTGGICVGQIFSFPQIFGTDNLWQYAMSFYTIFVIISCIPAYWFPESPRWLYIMKDNSDAARAGLERLRGKNAEDIIATELADMKLAANEGAIEKSSFCDVLRNSTFWLPLIIVCSFQACQQLSGINAIFFYSVPVFTKAGFSAEVAVWMNFGAGFLNFLIAAVSPYLMLKFNRRPLMMMSCGGCGLSLVGITFALKYIDMADYLPTLCIVFIASFIFFFNLGLAPIPYFIGGELFEISTRPVAMSLGCLFCWTGNFLIGMCFPLLEHVVGSFAFLPCAVMCLYGFMLTWCYLPETRGREPADLKPLMANGFKSIVKK